MNRLTRPSTRSTPRGGNKLAGLLLFLGLIFLFGLEYNRPPPLQSPPQSLLHEAAEMPSSERRVPEQNKQNDNQKGESAKEMPKLDKKKNSPGVSSAAALAGKVPQREEPSNPRQRNADPAGPKPISTTLAEKKEITSSKPTSSSNSPLAKNFTRTSGNNYTQSPPGHPTIPHTLFFTYSHDILQNRTPEELHDNIQNSIRLYRKAWNEPKAPVRFLTDETCGKLIQKVAPNLLQHFNEEADGSFKADICRVAALYKYGGYYLDADLHMLEPITLDNSVEFATVESKWFTVVQDRNLTGIFFQAFLASKANNTVLQRSLNVMKDWYTQKIPFNEQDLLGPATLRWAYDTLPKKKRGQVRFLKESFLDDTEHLYPNYPRQNGTGCCCDWVVHDPTKKHVYAYSRIVTAKGFKCSVEGPPKEPWEDWEMDDEISEEDKSSHEFDENDYYKDQFGEVPFERWDSSVSQKDGEPSS